ncbi:YccF domain-containing protein [Granulosicoccaceae sp. 1_MG-2023]|nr:YccF domain-containing protein [Granulosicoccaceae sp. 1_MG-2023]
MRTIGNLLWFVFGGFIAGALWWFLGLCFYLSVIGIPWGKAAFVIGQFSFWPVGRETVKRDQLTEQDDIGTGTAGTIGNIIWFLLAGIWLAIFHLVAGIACCLSIIGIPFGLQHFKLADTALAPIGKTVVKKEVASEVRRQEATKFIEQKRR